MYVLCNTIMIIPTEFKWHNMIKHTRATWIKKFMIFFPEFFHRNYTFWETWNVSSFSARISTQKMYLSLKNLQNLNFETWTVSIHPIEDFSIQTFLLEFSMKFADILFDLSQKKRLFWWQQNSSIKKPIQKLHILKYPATTQKHKLHPSHNENFPEQLHSKQFSHYFNAH